ncbi:MAG: hypothetical protein U9R42_01345 [Bacteroidota bacterium]|nr:hypothetical protein [Bacteroidota bacterium]
MKIYFIIFSILLSISVNAQSKKEIKKNAIESTTVWKYNYKSGKEKKQKESVLKFDKNGKIIEKIKYDKNTGKINKHIVFKYDSNGNKIKETSYYPDGKVKKVAKYTYNGTLKTEKKVYDDKGKLVSKKKYIYTIKK